MMDHQAGSTHEILPTSELQLEFLGQRMRWSNATTITTKSNVETHLYEETRQ